MLFSTTTNTANIVTPSISDPYLLTRLLAATHSYFSSTPANLTLMPWHRIRVELCHGRGSIKPGVGERKERKERSTK